MPLSPKFNIFVAHASWHSYLFNMTSERKHIFSRRDVWAILFLLACLLLGGAIMLYQKNNKKLPPELLIKTVQRSHEAGESAPASKTAMIESSEIKINLNTAPADSLELIPGIGPVYAEKIAKYREKYGKFSSVKELTKISGIGPRTLEKVEKYLTVE